jgi:RimJ/RimL family protein N-acetyltransferase
VDALTVPCLLDCGELLLRPWTTADGPQVQASAADPQIAVWNPMTYPTGEQWCANRADWSGGTHASWAVVPVPDPAIVLGSVSLHHIDDVQLDSEIGYWVAPAYRRQRVATRALSAATGFAFQRLGLHRVHLFHAVANTGSCAVAVAAGFLHEGTHRQSYRFGDGLWHDEHSHARLSTDRVTV